MFRLVCKWRSKRDADRNVGFQKNKKTKSSGSYGLGPWPSAEAAMGAATKFRNLVEFGTERRPAGLPLYTAPDQSNAAAEKERQARRNRRKVAKKQGDAYRLLEARKWKEHATRTEWIETLDAALKSDCV
eukprot:COSAG01_NODE_7345_length_3242_cov_6.925867_3_plen_130_part_00